MHVEMKKAYKLLVTKPERKKTTRKHTHIWQGSIKMDLRETRCVAVDMIHFAQDEDQKQALVSIGKFLWSP
jgi:hypothetical protein